MIVVYLWPRSALRHELHSDTLFGLICWGIRQVCSETRLVSLLARFAAGDPPFLLSSAFPFVARATGREHYLPKPLLAPLPPTTQLDLAEASGRKAYRALRWVPAEVFAGFLSGRWSEMAHYASGTWRQTPVPRLTRIDRLRSTIDRLSTSTDGAGTLFATPELWLLADPARDSGGATDGMDDRSDRTGGGLYFLLRGDDTASVTAALRFLEDFGFGGGVSTGHARFGVETQTQALFAEPTEADRFVTLSMYHPTAGEAARYAQGGAYYDLVRRKGKVGGHFLHTGDFWKRSVLMFAPGSTFPVAPGQRSYGGNPVVKGAGDGLPFEVQQFGYAFNVAMKTRPE
jgi:CRISPR-associated protein Csm4